jgi:hypothetical protein
MDWAGRDLRAIGGHLIDLYRLLAFDVRNPHSLSKFRNIDVLRRRTGARTMIETGTYKGVNAARCARMFDRVYTVELDPKLAREAKASLARWSNLEVIEGDGLVELPRLLARPDVQDVLVFLDGHFSGAGTATSDAPEPAVLEIEVLARYRDKVRAVVIDDFRCFGVDPDVPTKAELLRALETHLDGDYEIWVHFDQVLVARRPSGR